MLLSIVGGFWFLVDFDLRYFDLNLNDSSRYDEITDLGMPDKNIKKNEPGQVNSLNYIQVYR